MQVSENGINLIKSFEGLRLNAYQDVAGVWTIGYGCTFLANGLKVKKGDTLKDEPEASQLLLTIFPYFQNGVNSLVKVVVNQNQYDALFSFTYNEGVYSFGNSTLLRKLNSGNYQSAADQFLLWDKVHDPVTHQLIENEDLKVRRAKERELFLQPI